MKITTFGASDGPQTSTFIIPVDYNIYNDSNYLTDIFVNASNDLMTIAYESNSPAGPINISNYVEYTTNIEDDGSNAYGISQYKVISDPLAKTNTYDSFITTIDFDISDNIMPLSFDSVQYFGRHTDVRHLPLYPATNGRMRLWNNPILSEYDEYYIQFIGLGAGGQEGMIWEDGITPVEELSAYQSFESTTPSFSALTGDNGLSGVYQYLEQYDYGTTDPDDIIPTTVSGEVLLNDTSNNFGTFEYDEDCPITIYYTEINSIVDQVIFFEGIPSNIGANSLTLDDVTTSGQLNLSTGESYDITLTDTTLSTIKFNITKNGS